MNSRRVFNIAVLTIITTLIWFATSIYTTVFRKPNAQIEANLIKEIKIDDFDVKALEGLDNRIKYY